MNERDFCYWLQGFFEIVQHIDHRKGLPEEAIQEIKNHLALVLKKETPQLGKVPGVEAAPISPVAPSIPSWPQPPSVDPTPGIWPGGRPLTDWTRPGMMPTITC